jgi:hypothetical protein
VLLVLEGAGVGLALTDAYALNCSGRSKKAGTRSPCAHVEGIVALQGLDLQHPQKESPASHVKKSLALPQDASGHSP